MTNNDPIIIDLGIDGGQVDAMDDLVVGLRSITDEWRDLVAAMRDATSGMAAFKGAIPRSRSIVPAGPAARFANAQSGLSAAHASGDPQSIFDAQFRVLQTQTALANAQKRMNGNVAPAWAQAILSSRFSLGGGGASIQPLVGQSLRALGQAAGAAGAGLAVAAAAAIAFMEAVKYVRAVFADMRSGFWSSGGSGSFGQIAGIGAIMGRDGAQMGQMARALGDRLLNDPTAAMFGRRAGIDTRANSIFGSQDNAKQLMQAAEFIRNNSQSDAMRFARATGTEDLLGLRDISDSTFKEAKAMFEAMASPEMRKASAEFDAQLGILGGEFKKFLVEVIGPMLPGLTLLVRVGRALLEPVLLLVRGLTWLHDKFVSFVDWIARTFPWMFPVAPGNGSGASGGDKGAKDILRNNTNALDRNTDAIMSLTRQIFGGGARARRAIPSGWAHHSVQDTAAGAAQALGAFGL